MTKVLYCGEGAIKLAFPVEGIDIVPTLASFTDNGRFISNPLRQAGITVDRILPYEAREKFPLTAEELSQYDAVILSDVSHDAIIYYSGDRTSRIPQGPNRIKEIAKYVEQGGGLIFCGGDFTYQGRYGMGRWYGTAVAKVLPVSILPLPDDRVEAPEGALVNVVEADHPIMAGLKWEPSPMLFGYNKVSYEQKPNNKLLATIGEDSDPFIVAGTYGKGRVVAYTSDPGPEWGNGFNKWEGVTEFWPRVVKWVCNKI